MQHRSTQRTVTIITGGGVGVGWVGVSAARTASPIHSRERAAGGRYADAHRSTKDSYNNNRRHGRESDTHVSEQQVDDMRMQHRSTQRTVTIITGGTDSESDTHARRTASPIHTHVSEQQVDDMRNAASLDTEDSYNNNRRHGQRVRYTCAVKRAAGGRLMQHRSTQRTVSIKTGGTDSESDHSRSRAAVDDMRDAASLDTEDSYNNNRRHGQGVRYTHTQASSRWTICEMQHRSTQRTVTIITGGTNSESDTHTRKRAAGGRYAKCSIARHRGQLQ
ncbi:hypothetical protein J6590_009777 [Homalodisca vitripennis]|nr:hypothetical protein J6590_009777 [Homalodisca vitripennis]